MTRKKDSIQRLLDKGNSPDEIVESGKYTREEVNAYLNTDGVDAAHHNDEQTGGDDNATTTTDSSDTDTTTSSTANDGSFTIPSEEQLGEALNIAPQDVEEVIPAQSFNPFGGRTKSETERAYTKDTVVNPIHEVQEVYDRPDMSMIDDDDDGDGNGKNNDGSGTGDGTSGSPANPKLANISSDQKRIAAEKLYDLVIIPFYKQATEALALTSKFGDRKIRKLQAQGHIDLDMMFTYQDETGEIVTKSLRELVFDHNADMDKVFAYDQKFVDDAREPSIREFVKRGWGIAEDDELMWVLIMKVIELGQGALVGNLKKYDILSEAKTRQLEAKKERGEIGRTPPPPHQQQYQQPVQAQTFTPPPPSYEQHVNPHYNPTQPPPPADSHVPFATPEGNVDDKKSSSSLSVVKKSDDGIEEAEIMSEEIRDNEEK